MKNTMENQRLQTLFADLERIAEATAGRSPEITREIEDLRARILKLEKQISKEGENEPLPGDPGLHGREPKPTMYEADRIGYAYSNEKLESVSDSGYTIADAANLVVSPLAAGGQILGEVAIAPPADRQFSEEDVNLTNTVAQMASTHIQSLRLLAAAERSRSQAETASRRFIHESWDSYLDAIQRNERIGYTYDKSSVSPITGEIRINGGVQAAVKVLDETVGLVYAEPDPDRQFSEPDRALIHTVASQVAQQVENIRLLADASRARADADQTIRRLTRENWERFAKDREESEMGFAYDLLQVKPLPSEAFPQNVDVSHPLTIRGEIIGRLAVAGIDKLTEEKANLVSTIATQASIHLETLRLTEELQKRAKELQELDRLKSAFLANMSHELRTPLNSILGFTDVILEGLDGKVTEYMDNDLRLIQKNGQHLLHLINDVLDMAKIESGKMNLNPERFKVHSVLDEVISIASTLASEKNLSLFIEEGSDPEVEIYADSTRLRQVMINLINNAIKFTERGKISICARPMEGARILITVKDTGIGIPPDKLETVFQEFAQVDTSTTRKAGGTGLGLPISRRLVEMHGGRLWADSAGIDGEGSIFHVELPVEARITEVIEKQEK